MQAHAFRHPGLRRAQLPELLRRALSSRRAHLVVLALFALAYGALEILSCRMKSATWDEPIHLAAGHAMVAHGDYRVEATHPPFLRLWAALPLLAMGVEHDTSCIDRSSSSEWQSQAYEFAHQFLFVEQDADALLLAARSMVVLWGIVLGILLFCWAREWLGTVPAYLALAFYTVEPNLGAHARLVTTDLGATCFFFATVYFLWRTWRRPSPGNVVAVTLSFALANVTKFSGVILAPVALLMVMVPGGLRSRMGLGKALGLLAILAVGAFVAIWAVYGFRYAPSDSSDWLLRVQDAALVRENTPVMAAILGWVDSHHLLPNHFVQGFLYGQATVEQLPSYLAGEVSDSGPWYYFPLAFLLKTPVPLLVLLLGGLFVAVSRGRALGWGNLAFVGLPVAVYLACAIASKVYIGLRHILPIYPFVLLTAAAAARQLLAWRRPLGRLLLGGLCVFWLATFARVYPHTLTFFNEIAGGPSNGSAWLVDSNLDWGQDLKLLDQWMEEEHVSHVNLAYFGTADPSYYDMPCTYLPGSPFFAEDSVSKPVLPGYVAISATVQSGLYLQPEWSLFYSGFHDETPVVELGNSISVYWVEEWPESGEPPEAETPSPAAEPTLHAGLADRLAFALDWPEQALVHYRAALEARPEDSTTLGRLALALVRMDKIDEGIATFRRAIDEDPSNAEAQSRLAATLVACHRGAEALEPAQAAVRLTPDDPMARDTLGTALALLGRYDAAEAEFARALALAPEYAPAVQHLQLLREWRSR